MRKPGEKILAIARDIGLDGVVSMRSMSCPIHRWAKPWKMGVLPCPLRQNVAIFTCKDVILWTMPVGAASVTATGAVPRERNLYNLLIKQGADCLAFGSGAGGSINGYSRMNERNLQTRMNPSQQAKPLMMIMRNANVTRSGVIPCSRALKRRVYRWTNLRHAEKLAPLLASGTKGLSRDASTCLRLTNEGRFWASNILQSLNELIQVLNAPAIALEKP